MNIGKPLHQLITKLHGWIQALVGSLPNLVAAIVVVLVFWIAARSQAVTAIKRAFDANDITIPFPIRTLDFAAVGGSTLAEAVTGTALGKGANGVPPRRGA